MKKYLILSAVITALFLFAGCSSKPKPTPATPSAMPSAGAPAWVLKGRAAFPNDKGKTLYGVGSSSGFSDPATLRASSDNAARAELGRVFYSYTKSIADNYMSAVRTGDMKSTGSDSKFEQFIRTVSFAEISGMEIVDRWQDPATGEFFSLAKLDLEFVKEFFNKSNQISPEVKDYINKNAERMHGELDKEEQKYKGK